MKKIILCLTLYTTGILPSKTKLKPNKKSTPQAQIQQSVSPINDNQIVSTAALQQEQIPSATIPEHELIHDTQLTTALPDINNTFYNLTPTPQQDNDHPISHLVTTQSNVASPLHENSRSYYQSPTFENSNIPITTHQSLGTQFPDEDDPISDVSWASDDEFSEDVKISAPTEAFNLTIATTAVCSAVGFAMLNSPSGTEAATKQYFENIKKIIEERPTTLSDYLQTINPHNNGEDERQLSSAIHLSLQQHDPITNSLLWAVQKNNLYKLLTPNTQKRIQEYFKARHIFLARNMLKNLTQFTTEVNTITLLQENMPTMPNSSEQRTVEHPHLHIKRQSKNALNALMAFAHQKQTLSPLLNEPNSK